MKLLSGKCKEEFFEWYFNTYLKKNKFCLIKDVEVFFSSIELVIQNALIIESFDSVGIYIDVEFFRTNLKGEPEFVSSTTDEWNGLQPLRIQFKSRQQAAEKAIEKANEIRNIQLTKKELS